MNDVRPPVEQMNDLSWARVERGLWARLDGTQPSVQAAPARRRWLWIAVPSVAVAAAAAATFALLLDTPDSLRVAPVVAEHHEEIPTRIVSGAAPSTITHGDAHVTLDADSAVVMSRETETAVLERGGAAFAIPPRTGRPFVVIAGDAVIRVVDTKFRVARSAEHTTVDVERGSVDITFQGTTVKLGPGQSWTSEQQAAPVIEQPKPVVVKRPKIVAASADEREKYEQYVSLEAKNPQAALTGYLEIARGTSRWAEISLYAAARLSADRGEPRAKTLLDMYLRRFPRGANAADARQLLDRLKGVP